MARSPKPHIVLEDHEPDEVPTVDTVANPIEDKGRLASIQAEIAEIDKTLDDLTAVELRYMQANEEWRSACEAFVKQANDLRTRKLEAESNLRKTHEAYLKTCPEAARLVARRAALVSELKPV